MPSSNHPTLISTTGNSEDDLLQGSQEQDLILGKLGNDILIGRAANDTLKGGKGSDTLKGGQGDDSLKGGKGDDTLRGGKGNDTLRGGKGNDTLRGGKGDDTLRGGEGDDLLKGGKGDDRLVGNAGNDILRGGLGNDILKGGLGSDTLSGGGGQDIFVLNSDLTHVSSSTADLIVDFSKGEDRIKLSDGLIFQDLILTQGNGANANDTILTHRITGVYLAILRNVTATTLDETDFISSHRSGTLSFSGSTFSIQEDGTPVNAVTVVRTDGSDGELTATLELTGGTATPDIDFTQTPIEVSFADGEVSQVIDISVIDDLILEGDETVNLALVHPRNPAKIGSQNTSELSIIDDDGGDSGDGSPSAALDEAAWNRILAFNQTVGEKLNELISLGLSDQQLLTEIQAFVAAHPAEFSQVSLSTTSLSWQTQEGVVSNVDFRSFGLDLTAQGIIVSPTNPPPNPVINPAFRPEDQKPSNNLIQNDYARIIAPYFSDFEGTFNGGDESDDIEKSLKKTGFRTKNEANQNVDIESFRTLGENRPGIIVITSHGDTIDRPSYTVQNGIYSLTEITGNRADDILSFIATGVQAAQNFRDLLIEDRTDFAFGHLTLSITQSDINNNTIDNTVNITPSFINKYVNDLPNTFVYLGQCVSTINHSLIQAFQDAGAGYFSGYSDYVQIQIANSTGIQTFEDLVNGATTGQITGIATNNDINNAQYEGEGSTDLIVNPFLRNGDFEIGVTGAWENQGAASVINNLGSISASKGNWMAILRSSFSQGNEAYGLSQRLLVPQRATTLTLKYNIVAACGEYVVDFGEPYIAGVGYAEEWVPCDSDDLAGDMMACLIS